MLALCRILLFERFIFTKRMIQSERGPLFFITTRRLPMPTEDNEQQSPRFFVPYGMRGIKNLANISNTYIPREPKSLSKLGS